MLQEFKDFINKGNVIDLAVAVVMATAFKPVIDVFVEGILMQIVAAVFGEPDFTRLTLGVGDAELLYGAWITVIISFIMVAAAMFLVVKGYRALQRDEADGEAQAPTGPTAEELLIEIRDALQARS